jgi:hypothetical protein
VVSPDLTTTTTTLTSSVATSVYGQTVTLTATVAPTSGGGAPTGTVTFWDGATMLGTVALDATGVASFSTVLLGVGGHNLTAVYNGDAGFTQSTSDALAQAVTQATTTTTVGSSAATSSFGDPVTFTATVTPVAPGGGTPTGMVIFLDGDTVIGFGTLDASGQATLITAALSRGSHTITAVYSGDGNFTGLTAVGWTQTVI